MKIFKDFLSDFLRFLAVRQYDALRAEPTNKAGAEPNSFELCPARRRKTKSNLSKIYADAKGIMKKFVSFVFFDVP